MLSDLFYFLALSVAVNGIVTNRTGSFIDLLFTQPGTFVSFTVHLWLVRPPRLKALFCWGGGSKIELAGSLA